MEDWLTYRLSDLLLFSPRTYYRLIELHNRAWWPAHMAFLGIGVSILVLLRRGTRWDSAAITVLLSACWLFVAWAFHLERYATINWAAHYFAAASVVQALLLLAYGVGRRRLRFEWPRSPTQNAALGLVLFALFVEPLVGPFVGRSWAQLETFGITPDPTLIATLGVLALSAQRAGVLLVIPFFLSAISAATIWAMRQPDALVVLLAGLIGISLALLPRRGHLVDEQQPHEKRVSPFEDA